MADATLLPIIAAGVDTWNTWRFSHAGYPVDLRDAALSGAMLSRANFEKTDFRGANLSRANFQVAFLRTAYLRRADLTYADLRGADLQAANLRECDLRSADLRGANLRGASVRDALFDECTLHETNFANVNLSSARGLESCRHFGPSTIDHRTLLRSGSLPLPFLRGCGLPDNLISYLSTLAASPLPFFSCFISYSTKDQDFASKLHLDLQNAGVRCWFAPQDVQAGRKLHEQIDEAIRVHDKLLLILSSHSMASEWVNTEIAHARAKERTEQSRRLFPISLVPFDVIREWSSFDADTGKDLAREIREYFIPDFSSWREPASYEHALRRVLKDLRAEPVGIV